MIIKSLDPLRAKKTFIRKKFNFSEVHGAMNRNGSLSKFTGFIHFARSPLQFIAP